MLQRGPRQPLMADGQHHSSSQPASVRVQPFPQDAQRPCIYIALRCARCGDVRQALTELPTNDFIPCPECAQEYRFVLLGSGLTKRNLPFHEVHGTEQTRWDQRIEVETNSS